MEADTGNKIVDDGVSRIFENGPDCFPWTDAKIAEVEKEAEKKMSAKTIQELLATPQRNYVVQQQRRTRTCQLTCNQRNYRIVLLRSLVPPLQDIHPYSCQHLQRLESSK